MYIYIIRNIQDYCVYKCRLQVYTSSLVPTVKGEHNSLPLNIREPNLPKTFTKAMTSDDNILNAKKSSTTKFSLLQTGFKHNSHQTLP